MYYKHLDSLRALAVTMVVVFHWRPEGFTLIFPIGSWGVELFFVLSGFLITKILLESRLTSEVSNQSKLPVLKNFIIRRSLRIFPLYYLALFIILVFDRTNISGLKDHPFYFFGYASNFYFFKTQNFNYPMAHFWTLAVEEQFYLVWPWLILFLPAKFLKMFLTVSIFVGVLSRFFLSNMFPSGGVPIDVLTPTCIDCFAIGGLFSYYLVNRANVEKLISVINVGGVCAFVIVIIELLTKNNKFSFLIRTLDSAFCLAMVANAYNGFKGITGKIANSKALIYLGKISYGLYIYHLLTPWLTKILFVVIAGFNNSFTEQILEVYYNKGYYVRFSFDIIFLIAIASFSYSFFEKPINRYKYLFSDTKLSYIDGNFNQQQLYR